MVLRADAEDVGIAASLSAGMHSLMATFYKPTATKNKIIMLSSEFTSDILVSESWLDIHNFDPNALLLAEVSDRNPKVATDNVLKLIEANKQTVSIVAMSLVSSHFSHYYELNEIRSACKKYGIYLFIDLAHALGCVPINIA